MSQKHSTSDDLIARIEAADAASRQRMTLAELCEARNRASRRAWGIPADDTPAASGSVLVVPPRSSSLPS